MTPDDKAAQLKKLRRAIDLVREIDQSEKLTHRLNREDRDVLPSRLGDAIATLEDAENDFYRRTWTA